MVKIMNKIYPTSDFRKKRESLNFTQELMADYSGVSVRTIQNIEGGRGCKIDTLKDLSSVLEVPFSDFLPSLSTEKFKGSWNNLVLGFFKINFIKAPLYSLITILAFVGFITIYEQAEKIGIIERPSTQELLVFEQEMKTLGVEKVTPNQEDPKKVAIKIGIFTFIFIWFGFATTLLIRWLQVSRDFDVLISKPLDNFFQRMFAKVKLATIG